MPKALYSERECHSPLGYPVCTYPKGPPDSQIGLHATWRIWREKETSLERERDRNEAHILSAKLSFCLELQKLRTFRQMLTQC
jgi:hypothetical protein